MKQVTWLCAVVLLAAGCWAAAESGSVEVRPVEYEAKASEAFTLPREGAAGLIVRPRGDHVRGDIRVTAAEGDQIQVQAARVAHAESEGAARTLLTEMRLDRRREGDRWVLEASWPRRVWRRRVGSSIHSNDPREMVLEIRLPRAMSLEAQSTIGRIEATGVGETRLRSTVGDIRVQDLTGRLEAHTSAGGIRVDRCAGPVEVNAGAGGITIRQARSPVKATVGAGNIDVEVAPTRGALQLDLGTGAGKIDLRLPESASARVEASTSLSHVDMEPAHRARFNRERTHLEAVLGDGAGSVRLHAGIGDIRIRLASGR